MTTKKQFPYTFLQAVLLIIVGLVICSPIILLNKSLKQFLSDSDITALLGCAVFLVYWGLAYFINLKKGNRVSYSLKFPHKSSLLLFSIFIVIAFQLGITPLLGSGIKRLLDLQSHIENPLQYTPLTLVSMILLAPILEELVFRGTILKGFLSHYSVPKAIVFSTIIFGLFHLLPVALIGALLLGLYFGWVYYKTYSVGATILLHITANLTGLVAGYLRFRLADNSSWFNIYGTYTLFVVVISLIVCILLLRSVLKNTAMRQHDLNV